MRVGRQRITPFLWFDNQAEDAAKFDVSIFKDSRIESVARYDSAGAKAAGRPEGDPEKSERVMTALLQMKKIDIEGLRRAYAGGTA